MISFVYFDVGGVVIQDYSGTNKWQEMKRGMGINEEKEIFFNMVWEKYKDEVCIGKDVDSLIPIIENDCQINLPQGYSLLTDFINRFEKNPSIWPVIAIIQKLCKVGLLTNMYPRLFEGIRSHGLLPPNSWNVVIDSSVVGYQKPDRKIFEIAEKKAQTKKQEILFVENDLKNIQAASDFGWQTFLYDSKNPRKSSGDLMEKYFSKIIIG
jgi:HAD superfamily hydrolase (TIGR01509 family)